MNKKTLYIAVVNKRKKNIYIILQQNRTLFFPEVQTIVRTQQGLHFCQNFLIICQSYQSNVLLILNLYLIVP